MKTFRHLFAASALLLCMANANAQYAVAAAGGNTTGEGGSISYTVGQTFYTTAEATSGASVAAGVQQAYVVETVTSLPDDPEAFQLYAAYPNPVKDQLTLRTKSDTAEKLVYQILDAQGKLLAQDKVAGAITSISMAQFTPAVYIVRVVDGQKTVASFKVIKN
ncbi:MAG: T9SS type A sorting domain-containing protein [Bacteroidales bacterium]|nr:T9SS type A sorting domain-containing protein [Bacteroidales bacterium]